MHDDKLKAAHAALTDPATPKPGSFWRHAATGGEYVVCGGCVIEAAVEPALAYRGLVDIYGTVWVRPLGEFTDGRFIPIDAPTEPEGG